MRSDLVVLGDLGGGINRGDPPTSIARNQCSDILNFKVKDSHLERRGGMARVMTLPYASVPSRCTPTTIHGIYFFDSGAMLLGLYDSFARRSGIGAVLIPSGMDVVAPSVAPWSIVDNKGVLWCARKDGRLWLVSEFLASIAGINPPVTAPTLANGGAGLVGIGTYQYFVTFLTTLGDESDPSPIATITLAALSDVDLTNIPISAQSRVTAKRIWRSLPNDAGQLWLVASIGPGVTSYTDNTPNGTLGEPFEYDNGLPPASVYSLAKFAERLWTHDKVQVYGSKVGRFETFSETFDSFDARDDRQVRGLHAWDARLMVGTTQKIFQLRESGFDEAGARFDVTPFSGDHGVVSHGSMDSAEGRLFWLDNDGVFGSDGGTPECLSTPRVRDFILGVAADSLEYSVGHCNNSRTEYSITIGTPGTDEHIQLVYNWRTGAWTTEKYKDDSSNGTPVDVAPTSVAVRADIVFVAFDGYNFYQLDDGDVDRGVSANNIDARARFCGVSAPGMRSALKKVELGVTSAEEEIAIRLYQDGRAAAARQNSVPLNALPDRDLKRISLGEKLPGYTPLCDSYELEVEYSGEAPIEISEVRFEQELFSVHGRSQ